MGNSWIVISLLALTASISTSSDTLRLVALASAIHDVLEDPTASAPANLSLYQGNPHVEAKGCSCPNYVACSKVPGAGGKAPCVTSFPRPGVEFRRPTCFEFDIDYFGSDILKLEDGRVRNPEACQQMCATTHGCAYWTYIPGTSACYLKSKAARHGRTCRPSAISGPRVCPPPHGSCYEIDTGYHGCDEKIVDNQVQSPEECHILCLSFAPCQFWTWVPSQRKCYLKNEHAGRGSVHAPGSVSGPRQCITVPRQCVPVPPPPPTGCSSHGCKMPRCYEEGCYDQNVTYVGADVEATVTACGPRECQYFCQQHPACRGFTFYSLEKKCMLMSENGVPAPMENAISGPKFCYTSECALKDVEYYGLRYEAAPGPSFAACHKQCRFSAFCSAVNYNNTSQQCSLIQRSRIAPGFVSGPKNCRAAGPHSSGDAPAVQYIGQLGHSFCHYSAVAYSSKPFSIRHLDSAELCQTVCRSQPRCKFFTYFLFGKACLMHENEGQKVPNVTAVSGPRECPPSACFHKNVEVYGKRVGRCTTEDASTCQKVCQKNKRCSFFSYDLISKVCSLTQHRGPAPGITSAPLHCGMPDDELPILREPPPYVVAPGQNPPMEGRPPPSRVPGSPSHEYETPAAITASAAYVGPNLDERPQLVNDDMPARVPGN